MWLINVTPMNPLDNLTGEETNILWIQINLPETHIKYTMGTMEMGLEFICIM